MTIRQRLNEIPTDPADPGNTAAGTTQTIRGQSGSEIGTGGFPRENIGDGFRMWNLAYLLDPIDGAPPFTRIYRDRGELIDHIFARHRLVNPNNEPFVRIFMAGESLPSMDDGANARKKDLGSDQAAVVDPFDV